MRLTNVVYYTLLSGLSVFTESSMLL